MHKFYIWASVKVMHKHYSYLIKTCSSKSCIRVMCINCDIPKMKSCGIFNCPKIESDWWEAF
jgi:hypothetical protein